MRIGQIRVPGQATIYDGAVVETGSSPAQFQLRNGATVRLSAGAKATLRSDGISLERGTGQVDTPVDYSIQAHSLRVLSTSRPSSTRLELKDDGSLRVASLSGPIEVRRMSGGLLGRMVAGKAMIFAPESGEAGAAAPLEIRGCLSKSHSRFLLHDPGTAKTITLVGGSFTAKSGDRVVVIGNVEGSASGTAQANQVVRVLRLTVEGHGCGNAAAAAGAAGAGAGGAAGASKGISATTAVIAGVAVTGAALIPTIALTSGSDSSSSISPQSR